MINLNLNNFLLAISHVLDYVEMDILGVTSNHSKRVAFISLNLAQELGLSNEQCFDIVALSILHDNGVSQRSFHSELQGNSREKLKHLEEFKHHCTIGEENIKSFPFLTDVSNILKYHHERYDGNGYFGIKGDDIPIMTQIITLADIIDLKFSLKEDYTYKEKQLLEYLRKSTNLIVSSQLIDAFFTVNKKTNFEMCLRDEYIDKALANNIPSFTRQSSYEEIREITKVFSKIIDCKSRFTAKHSLGLSNKVAKMADYYQKNKEEKFKLMIAADLHDIGKLTIPNTIIDKPGRVNSKEFNIIKTHAYYTRTCLESLEGFEDIVEWASNHHEKLNGQGYPRGLKGDDLDFNSRLMACLDIYQALTEERPYRKPSSHEDSMKILLEMAEKKLIDENITNDIDIVFNNISTLE